MEMEIETSLQILSDEAYTYRALIIATLCIASIAIVLSLLLMFGMTLPLFFPTRRKQYSTYNLYLAYLSLPDFVVYTYLVHLILTRHDGSFFPLMDEDGTIQWMWEDNRFDHSVYAVCVTANLYTNAFLIWECYLLLWDSANVRRHAPPSIKRVTKHAMIAYGIGIFAFVLEVLAMDLDPRNRWFIFYQTICYLIFVIIPLSVLAILWVKIHLEGLVGLTRSMYQGRLTVLVSYFVRIVVTYLLCTGIGTICYMVYWSTIDTTIPKVFCYITFLFFSGIQATANFALSLTKPNARQFVWNLLICDYCNAIPTDKKEQETELDSSHDDEDLDPFLGVDQDVEITARRMSITPEPSGSHRNSSFLYSESLRRMECNERGASGILNRLESAHSLNPIEPFAESSAAPDEQEGGGGGVR